MSDAIFRCCVNKRAIASFSPSQRRSRRVTALSLAADAPARRVSQTSDRAAVAC